MNSPILFTEAQWRISAISSKREGTPITKTKMRILDLSLTYHWYDEIEAGRKKEEYREDKPFYRKRFMSKYRKDRKMCSLECPECIMQFAKMCLAIPYDAIRFHRGQGSKQTMLVEWKGLSFGYGSSHWGAPTDHKVWIIKLGDKL